MGGEIESACSKCVACLFQVLRTNPCIVEVDLGFCSLSITEDNGQLLVKMLTENNTLRSLELHVNPAIDDSGVFCVAKGLCHNTGLERLSLRGCGMTEKGAKSLAEMLMENRTLQSLNISYNELGDGGIAHVSNSLTVNSTLQELDIKSCNLTVDGFTVLVHSLSTNSSLSDLYLSGNTISDLGTHHIANLLKHNQGLKTIELRQCGITEIGQAKVEREREAANEIRGQQGLPQLNIEYSW